MDDELRGSFRFGRDAIAELLGLLGFPDVLRSASGRRFGGEEAFLLLFRRLGGRERGLELAQVFGRSPPAISEINNLALDHVFMHDAPAMRLEIWEEHLPAFASVLRERVCPEGHCFGFIDGTMFTICRPTTGQEAMYNGWKRQHKVKYQCVVLPNFLIGDWFGPAVGRVHDSQVQADSDMVARLQRMRDRLDVALCVASCCGRSDSLLLANTTDGAHVELEEDGTVVRRQEEVYFMIPGGAFHGLSHGGVLQPYPLKDSAYQNLSEIQMICLSVSEQLTSKVCAAAGFLTVRSLEGHPRDRGALDPFLSPHLCRDCWGFVL